MFDSNGRIEKLSSNQMKGKKTFKYLLNELTEFLKGFKMNFIMKPVLKEF